MDTFTAVLSIFSIVISVATMTFVAYDCIRRKEYSEEMIEFNAKLAETTRMLGETHNAIVSAQKAIFDRLEMLDTRTSALVSQITPSRKF